jgi:hypothetical protein
MLGNNKGGKTEFVAEAIADTIESLSGQSATNKATKLQSVVDSLPPDEVLKLKVALEQIEADREKTKLDHDLAMHQAQQATLQSADVKAVRPTIANRHSYFTMGYVGAMELLNAFDYGTGANWEIAGLIASPTLAWFGFRTWDKFSKHGAS